MPSKRSTRVAAKPATKRLKKPFALKAFRMTHFTVTRPVAIGIIITCIVGTALLIVATTSEPTSAASAVPGQPLVAIAPTEHAPIATPVHPASKVEKRSPEATVGTTTVGTVEDEDVATVEGCLLQDGDQFRLKNTSGEDAPRGRSWKSAFLRKGSKSIDVIDHNSRLNLARHVGERVTITGTLDGHQLQGTSLTRAAESCN